jgi:hypothetical protein
MSNDHNRTSGDCKGEMTSHRSIVSDVATKRQIKAIRLILPNSELDDSFMEAGVKHDKSGEGRRLEMIMELGNKRRKKENGESRRSREKVLAEYEHNQDY